MMAGSNIPKPNQAINIDTAYSPPRAASIVENKAVVRTRFRVSQTFVLSTLAGIYIVLGTRFAAFVTSDSALHFGAYRHCIFSWSLSWLKLPVRNSLPATI